MTKEIEAAEAAIKQGQEELFTAVKAAFPIGAEVKAHGPRDPMACTVIGYKEPDAVIVKVKKSGAEMTRRYSSLTKD